MAMQKLSNPEPASRVIPSKRAARRGSDRHGARRLAWICDARRLIRRDQRAGIVRVYGVCIG